jgi:hypothetical protein
MINNDWKTRHVRVPCFFNDDGWERGGLTLRYRINSVGVEYKYSICNPKDQYSRKLGILWAETTDSRLLRMFIDNDETSFQRESAILHDIVSKDRENLSGSTLGLIHDFVRRGCLKEVSDFFYPKV